MKSSVDTNSHTQSIFLDLLYSTYLVNHSKRMGNLDASIRVTGE